MKGGGALGILGEAPMEDSSAVMQVPMFCPMMRGMAMLKETMPVGADGLKNTHRDRGAPGSEPVTSAPTSTPRMGLRSKRRSHLIRGMF